LAQVASQGAITPADWEVNLQIICRRIARSSFLILFVIIVPQVCLAQESGAEQQNAGARKSVAARPMLNEQQKSGEAWFVQNCTLCHMPTNQKKRLKIQAPPLEGMYGEDADSDALRQFIQQGIPGMMPAFRFGLDAKQVDDIVAYLKTGAHLKASAGGN
jgi:mono/diheme cytochrome c family protein